MGAAMTAVSVSFAMTSFASVMNNTSTQTCKIKPCTCTCCFCSGYRELSGTSSATPHGKQQHWQQQQLSQQHQCMS
jgi:hypothetical protein